ncbi:hypothetical protein GCM10011490_23100 [Pseudoclavibacter endophyticus]|uniref:Uncharacterized protein n=1 Tax=Pseudoclavibacter endophyticus TaxID=1778590 RepID=A0A6H9WH23_9MICO|nr:hypothetical protein [Pseudoclavibacter endophyticus]KAB1648334.1 hypothetical protein F8O04_11590 [Pseudoclavibacter endophyticus]GGA71751.1 hypothetical protein GCM10011490_23100 [Pseudoclavibacter endophyticus]
MRRVAPVLCTALLLVGASGCSSDEGSSLPETAEAVVGGLETSIEELAGVSDAILTAGQNGTQVSLSVHLEEDVTPEQVQEAAARANDLRTIELPDGVYPGQIDLRLGASVYSYFALPSVDGLRAQADYWAELVDAGAVAVNVRTYTQPLPSTAAPDPDHTGGGPALMNTPTGRYVGITLPNDDAEETAATIASIRGIQDPGASVGEWHFVSPDGALKAEYASPGLPEAEDMALAASLLSATDNLNDTATLALRIEQPDEWPRLSVKLTAFDGDLEESTTETIEDDLRETEIWPSMQELVATLANMNADYEVSLLSNALVDAGNFQLLVTGNGCDFSGDDDWPLLSQELESDVVAQAAMRQPGACVAA